VGIFYIQNTPSKDLKTDLSYHDTMHKKRTSSNTSDVNDTLIVNIGETITMEFDKKEIIRSIWEELLDIGFNSPRTMAVLKDLHCLRGGYLYYNELIKATKDNQLDDEVNAYIISILASAYESIGVWDDFAVASNKRSRIIQSFIKEQLENPSGKQSLLSAMKSLPDVYGSERTQAFLDNELQNNRFNIPSVELYKRKVISGSLQGNAKDFTTVIHRVDALPISEQKEIFSDLLHTAQFIPHIDDGILKKEFLSYVTRRMPQKPIKPKEINYKQIAEETYKSFNIDESVIESIVDEKEKQRYIDKMSAKLQNKYSGTVGKLTNYEDQRLYQDSINAIITASTTKEQTYYDSAKKLYLESDDYEYKQTILDLLKVFDEDADRLREDQDIKNAMLEESTNPNLTQQQKRLYDWHLNTFFKQ
jgi:hypothetical protein